MYVFCVFFSARLAEIPALAFGVTGGHLTGSHASEHHVSGMGVEQHCRGASGPCSPVERPGTTSTGSR